MNSTLLISGLVLGSMYALAGLGLVIVYRSARVVNLAHGAQASVAAFVFQEYRENFGTPLAMLIALLAAVGTGLALEFLTVRLMHQRDALSRLAVTIGFFLFMQGFLNWVFPPGSSPYASQVFGQGTVTILGVVYSADQLGVFAATIVVGFGLALLFRKTTMGVVMRAASDRPDIAEAIGINTRRTSMIAWSLGGLVAGLAGVLLTPLVNLDPIVFALLVIQAYSAILIGGMSSLSFTVVGGLILGVVQVTVDFHSDIIGLGQSTAFAAALVALLAGSRKLAWSKAEELA